MSNLVILEKVGSQDPIFDVVVPQNTVGGGLLVLGARNENGTYAGAANADATDNMMVLVAPVCLPYSDKDTEHTYEIETNAVERAYLPVVGRQYAIPVSNIIPTIAVAVGKAVVPKKAEIKMECLNAAVGTEAVEFVVKKTFTKAGVAYASLLCVKA